MTQKITLFFCLLICLSIETFGQVKIYFNKNRVPVSQIDSAKYYKICEDSLCNNGIVSMFYTENNQLRLKQTYKNKLVDGEELGYYSNGQLKSKAFYKDGILQGTYEHYYQDGKKSFVREEIKENNMTVYKYLNAWDTLGIQILKDGDGKVIQLSEDGQLQLVTDYKNGERNGKEVNYFANGKIYSIETYKNGKFIEGESWDIQGNRQVSYNSQGMNHPQFKGGLSALSSFLSKNIVYPKDASIKKIQGTVYVQFVINKLGKVENAKVIKGITELDQEALRVVNLMPDWEAGTLSGQKISVQYVLPITFKLSK